MPPLALGAWRPLTDTARLLMHCDRCTVIDEAPDSPRQPDPRTRTTNWANRVKPGVARRIVQCAKIVPYLLPGNWSRTRRKLVALAPETC